MEHVQPSRKILRRTAFMSERLSLQMIEIRGLLGDSAGLRRRGQSVNLAYAPVKNIEGTDQKTTKTPEDADFFRHHRRVRENSSSDRKYHQTYVGMSIMLRPPSQLQNTPTMSPRHSPASQGHQTINRATVPGKGATKYVPVDRSDYLGQGTSGNRRSRNEAVNVDSASLSTRPKAIVPQPQPCPTGFISKHSCLRLSSIQSLRGS